MRKDEIKLQKKRRFVLFVLSLTLIVLFSVLIVWEVYVNPQTDLIVDMVEQEQLKSNQHTNLYYKDAETGEWRLLESLYDGEQTQWVSYKNIPVDLRNAAVAIEDKRFWDHHGVDFYRTGGAVLHSIRNKLNGSSGLEGGSTITQQMIKNVTGNDSVTIKRKLFEIIEALKLENRLSKEEIMEMYLNNIYFGRNSYGIYSASYTYFGKSVQELNLCECAILISITNNPSYYDPYRFENHVFNRAAKVLKAMCVQGYITEDEWLNAGLYMGYDWSHAGDEVGQLGSSVTFKDGSLKAMIADGGEATDGKYSWFTDAVIEALIDDLKTEKKMSRQESVDYIYHGGLDIYTTFDPAVQAAVDGVYLDTDRFSQYVSDDGDVLQSGMVIMNQKTGGIVAISGGVGVKAGNRIWNRAIQSRLAPASTLKLFSAYIPAIESGKITIDSYVEDVPFTKENGEDYPSNEYGSYYGRMSLRDAVAESTNTVPMFLVQELGLNTSYQWLTDKFGLLLNADKDKNYASLSLGGLTDGVSILDMTACYATIPRMGSYVKPYFYTLVEDADGDTVVSHENDGTMIYSRDTASQVNELLSGVVEYGTGKDVACTIDVCGKTGTSNDDKDFWFCGYNSYYTASVWCGYDSSQTIPSDRNLAVDVWHDVMQQVINFKKLE